MIKRKTSKLCTALVVLLHNTIKKYWNFQLNILNKEEGQKFNFIMICVLILKMFLLNVYLNELIFCIRVHC